MELSHTILLLFQPFKTDILLIINILLDNFVSSRSAVYYNKLNAKMILINNSSISCRSLIMHT